MYVHYIYNYEILIYLYYTVCLYNKSSEGVNLFRCSSSMLGRKPPSNAAALAFSLFCVQTMLYTLAVYRCTNIDIRVLDVFLKKSYRKADHLP